MPRSYGPLDCEYTGPAMCGATGGSANPFTGLGLMGSGADSEGDWLPSFGYVFCGGIAGAGAALDCSGTEGGSPGTSLPSFGPVFCGAAGAGRLAWISSSSFMA
jgi:hypothetical protein